MTTDGTLPTTPPRRRLPEWVRVRPASGPDHHDLKARVRELGLHTVCESASCPNIGECWNRRTLTVMILGNVCTRSCGFCDVATGRPGTLDADEPRHVAELLAGLDLAYAVVTSVDRDDLPDGGAAHWAATIRAIRALAPRMGIEVLIPDFHARPEPLDQVIDAAPDVLAHNLETVASLQRTVRPQASYARSLAALEHAAKRGVLTKSSLMLGLGETLDEVREALRDLRDHGCRILTLGQYLRPSLAHLPVARFWEPAVFDELGQEARAMGFDEVASGPLVRSSYRADELAAARVRGDAAAEPTAG